MEPRPPYRQLPLPPVPAPVDAPLGGARAFQAAADRAATAAERRQTGAWWSRDLVGEYLPPLRLDPRSGAPAHHPRRVT